MHRVINDEECAKLVKDQIRNESEDRKMLTEEEQQKEAKLNEMI
jgi:hypothetical protein